MNLSQAEKALIQLEGILMGIAADGIVNLEEARYLEYWLELQDETRNLFPFSILAQKVNEILVDGIVTDQESKEIMELIRFWQDTKPQMWSPDSDPLETLGGILHRLPIGRNLKITEIRSLQSWAKAALAEDFPQKQQILLALAEVLKDWVYTQEEHAQLEALLQKSP